MTARVIGACFALVGVIVMAQSATPGNAVVNAQVSSADGARLELVEQTFAFEPDASFRLDYRLTGLTDDPLELVPAEPAASAEDTTTDSTTDSTVVPTTPDPPDATQPEAGAASDAPTTTVAPPPLPEPLELTVEVANYQPINNLASIDGLVGSDVDPDLFETVSDVVDGVAIDLRPLATVDDDGTVRFSLDIGTDVGESVGDLLKFDTAGLYPVRVQLLVGDPDDDNVVATAGTFVQRLPASTEPAPPPPIDLAVVTATPELSIDPPAAVAAAAASELRAAIDLAGALDAPVTLEVPPTLIAEATATTAGGAVVATALTGDELVSMPLVPLDVSSAVAADRADAYTQLVIDGENVLTDAVPTTPTRRDVWIATSELSSGGAELLRDLGARYVVFPEALYQRTVSEQLPATDLFVDVELDDGGRLPLLVVDPLAADLTPSAASDTLEESTATEWAVRTVTGMLVEQRRDDRAAAASTAAGVAGSGLERSRILSTPDLRAPDARLLDALDLLASTTPSIRFAAASALTGVTDVQNDDGAPLIVQLPATAGPPLDERIRRIEATGLSMLSVASMLPEDDPRPAEWSAELALMISTGYSDEDVVAATAALEEEAERLRNAVVLPEPFTFTLTGRRGTIEIRLGNTIAEDLTVVVHLESSKVNFPDGDQTVTLRGLDETSVIVPVEARSNGTSSIELSVRTPTGEPLDEPVTLTARVTALTGLGQVLTAGFVLVLLTWWFTHWRNRRRAGAEDDPDEDDDPRDDDGDDDGAPDPNEPPEHSGDRHGDEDKVESETL